MSIATSLLSRLLPCCASATSDLSTVQALLDKHNVGILSAACCDATSAPKDEQLKTNVLQAMQASADVRPLVIETITAAQRHLRELGATADDSQKRLVANVVTLFQTHGLSIFPILIINGRVAYYGGVPSAQMIQERLQQQPLAAVVSA
jgi:hypothetical protein